MGNNTNSRQITHALPSWWDAPRRTIDLHVSGSHGRTRRGSMLMEYLCTSKRCKNGMAIGILIEIVYQISDREMWRFEFVPHLEEEDWELPIQFSPSGRYQQVRGWSTLWQKGSSDKWLDCGWNLETLLQPPPPNISAENCNHLFYYSCPQNNVQIFHIKSIKLTPAKKAQPRFPCNSIIPPPLP